MNISIKSDYQHVLHIPIAAHIVDWYDQTDGVIEEGQPQLNCDLLTTIDETMRDLNYYKQKVISTNRDYQDALEELELAQDKLQTSITNAENQFKNI